MPEDERHQDLEESVLDLLTDSGLSDLTAEVGEGLVDTLLDSDLADQVPVYKTIKALWKAGVGIREYRFARMLHRFLFQLRSVPREERERFAERMRQEEGLRQRVGFALISTLDRLDELKKPALLALAFEAYIAERLSLYELQRFWAAIERCHIADLRMIEGGGEAGLAFRLPAATAMSLLAVGIVELVSIPTVRAPEVVNEYALTDMGAKFCVVVMQPAAQRWDEL